MPVAQVTVAIGGKSATVQYAGASPGTVNGIIQVNAIVPSGLPAGAASADRAGRQRRKPGQRDCRRQRELGNRDCARSWLYN